MFYNHHVNQNENTSLPLLETVTSNTWYNYAMVYMMEGGMTTTDIDWHAQGKNRVKIVDFIIYENKNRSWISKYWRDKIYICLNKKKCNCIFVTICKILNKRYCDILKNIKF